MNRIIVLLACVVIVSGFTVAALANDPRPIVPDVTVINITGDWEATGDLPRQALLISLQGLANKHAANIYLLYPEDHVHAGTKPILDYYRTRHGIRTNTSLSLEDAVRKYRKHLKGYVVWDPTVLPSLMVSFTIAGIEDALVITEAHLPLMKEMGLTPVADLRERFRGKADVEVFQWAYDQYWQRCSRDYLVYLGEFLFEDDSLHAGSENLAFTLADFMSMDDRFFSHFAIVPAGEYGDDRVSVTQALEAAFNGIPSEVPVVTLVDTNGNVRHAITDDRLLRETRRCLTMWHSLQELGGIHNSHAERLLAKELKSRSVETSAKTPTPEIPQAETPPLATEVAPIVEPVAEDHGDDPYIESARCTTCNECTNLNPRMFAYNAEKQAYIADADAGTFRQLVEAAEGCQVSIIHPGKPRNPKEPGLEDLIGRAAEFN